jgi:hypothetical protein
MALNAPLLKLYDCAQFALDDINEFAKGQGYAVSKFSSKAGNRGRGRRGSAQTSSRGGSSQISSSTASRITTQSTQTTQEQLGSITGGITGGKNSGGSQNASADGLLSTGGNISQAYSGRGALPFQNDFAEGSFSAFQL